MSKEILHQFEIATKEFCSYARAISPDKVANSPKDGEWSYAYVIHHMADSDAHFAVRFLNVLSVDGPAIIPFDEEIFPTALHYPGRSVDVSIAAIEASCAHMVDILKQIAPEDWNRTGIHAERGKLTLSEILQLTTNHRIGHLDQLKQ
jgi:uncharacterized damage-inducible protein DinB